MRKLASLILGGLVVAGSPTVAHAAGPVTLGNGIARANSYEAGVDDVRSSGTGLSFTGNTSIGGASAHLQMDTTDAPGGMLITGSGNVSSPDTNLPDPAPHSASGGISISRDFEVGTAVPYRLSATWSRHGGPDANSVLTTLLTDPPDIFFHSRDADGTETVSESGTLQPGSYEFQIDVACIGGGACTASLDDLEFEVGNGKGDSDGDGLLDSWETDGIDFTDNGSVDLDLPAMGADPEHKDIFLEIDQMPGHVLSQAAIDQVIAAFAAAPVANPDGNPGVTLHVDNGPASPMKPGGQTWGALSDQDTLTHQDVLGTETAGDYDWSAFDLVKAGNFSVDREPAFHYVVSGHGYGDPANDSSGISRGIGASDLLVTLGAASAPGEGSGTVAQQAGTLMHELGHNLGLRHGGINDTNYKPNYLSIMNYSFQFSGLLHADGTTQLDYSRLGISLSEGALDENNGFGFAAGSEPARFLTAYKCPDGSVKGVRLLAGPIDWNCDNVTQGQVASDVNGDGVLTAFAPFLDWPALDYKGGGIGDLGASPLPDTTEMIEPQLDELLENQKALESIVNQTQESPPAPTPAGTLPIASGGTAAPKATLSGATSQKLGKSISVTVICSEACDAAAGGTVSVPNASKAFKISAPTIKLGKSGSAKLKLTLSKKLRAAAKRALKKRKKVKAAITVTVKNTAGAGTAKRTIKLKR